MTPFIAGETKLAERCGITNLWDGDTTPESRRERVRKACIELESVIAWRGPDGKPETYGAAYMRVYGSSL